MRARYASSEKKIRYPAGDGHPKGILEIEPKDPPVYKIPFRVLLEKYKVEYTSTSSLGDLETEFWQALFKAPNDELDDEQYCHSPWFHRCCREEKSVRQLKESGDWDEIWFQMRPRKTINFPGGQLELNGVNPGTWQFATEAQVLATPAPTQIEVAQLDLDTVGITLLDKPTYLTGLLNGGTVDANGRRVENPTGGLIEQLGKDVEDELKVMVILKC